MQLVEISYWEFYYRAAGRHRLLAVGPFRFLFCRRSVPHS